MGMKKRAKKELKRIQSEIDYWRDEIAKNEKICNPDEEVKQATDRYYGYVNELQHLRGVVWHIQGKI